MAEEDQELVESVKEGSRWRYARPSSDEVEGWFKAQPLDEGMNHDDYVSGVVLIPANEKVKITGERNGKKVQEEIYEMTYTPYVRVDMRVLYFRKLAEARGMIRVVEPVEVPKITDVGSAYYNAHMATGLWWHVVPGEGNKPVRFLVATWRVALYEREPYIKAISDPQKAELPVPMLEGIGSKQVSGGVEPNAIMRAETGAIGRALGTAGILVVGTGIATAEDMQEAMERQPAAEVPGATSAIAPAVATDPERGLDELRTQAFGLQEQLKNGFPDTWKEFVTWWTERSKAEGWTDLNQVPLDALRGIVGKMERMLDAAQRMPQVEEEKPADEQTQVQP